MRGEGREDVTLPCITTREVAAFWNMGPRKFRRLFDLELKSVIRTFKDKGGTRHVLIDVLKAAFPNADDQTRYFMAYRYLREMSKDRVEKYGNHNRSGGSES